MNKNVLFMIILLSAQHLQASTAPASKNSSTYISAIFGLCTGIGIGIGTYLSYIAHKQVKKDMATKDLHFAARTGDSTLAQSALEAHADITAKENGATALVKATMQKHNPVVALIVQRAVELSMQQKIDASSYLDIRNEDNNIGSIQPELLHYTPLHIAVKQGSFDIVKTLCNARADYQLIGQQYNAIGIAATFKQYDIAQFLLSQPGVDVEYQVPHICKADGCSFESHLDERLRTAIKSVRTMHVKKENTEEKVTVVGKKK